MRLSFPATALVLALSAGSLAACATTDFDARGTANPSSPSAPSASVANSARPASSAASSAAASSAAPSATTPAASAATASPSASAATPSAPSASAASSGAASSGAANVTCAYDKYGSPARPVDPPSTSAPGGGTLTYTMQTNEGPVRLVLDRAAAPCAVHSFESLVKQKFFADTRCHRLVDKGIFALMCGDPSGTGTGGPGYRFGDELTGNEKYPAKTIAMANSDQPNTNGSQFFIVYQDSDLPAKYTILGHLADDDSLGVINKIAAMGQDGSNPTGGGKPFNKAQITSIAAG